MHIFMTVSLARAVNNVPEFHGKSVAAILQFDLQLFFRRKPRCIFGYNRDCSKAD